MGPGIHPRLKRPVGQRLALGALQAAYGLGDGAFGGVIEGCSYSTDHGLILSFNMRGRKLVVRPYNRSNIGLSATSVLVNSTWLPVHVSAGAVRGSVTVDLTSISAETPPTGVRYAWGGVTGDNAVPNGADVTCCEGDGVNDPCLPTQCPFLASEPNAPFGYLPVDPFIAQIVDGKCVCPSPQTCSK